MDLRKHKYLLILLIVFANALCVSGQHLILSDSDYVVYNYLIHQTLVEDTSLRYYEARIKDSTNAGPYLYDLKDTGTFISSHDYCTFAMIKRPKCQVDKTKLITWSPKRTHKLAKFPHVFFEFSKCYFFNNGNSVILYFSSSRRAGYTEILKRDGNGWQVIKKRLQWVE